MSILPMLHSTWWEDLTEPHRILDQNFGVGIHPEQIPTFNRWLPDYFFERRFPSTAALYYRPWSAVLQRGSGGGLSMVKPDKNKFEVVLDVQQFKPEEIKVKVVDNCVVVEGKHEEKRDEHGWISRQFERRYLIPDQCNVDEVVSSLSTDGILTIIAPRKEEEKIESERPIEIQHTGKPAIAVENGPGKPGEEQAEKSGDK